MEIKDNKEEWKFGVSFAAMIILFGAAPFMYFLFPSLTKGTATAEEVDLWWKGYLILLHLSFLLQLKVIRTIYKRYVYVIINDVVMSIVLNDIIDRVFDIEYVRWYDFLGIGIITALFIIKHYNWLSTWQQKIERFLKK